MIRQSTYRLRLYAVLALAGPALALGMGRPEPAVLTLPFAVAVVLGLLAQRLPVVEVSAKVTRDRILEGEHVPIEITLRSDRSLSAEIIPHLPANSEWITGRRSTTVSTEPGQTVVIDVGIEPNHWGPLWVGVVDIRVTDGRGLISYARAVDQRQLVRVLPRPEALRTLARPARPRQIVGVQPSRHPGEGLEFADVREYRPGDRMRSVNWRASARRPELYVNDRHPDHSADVVLMLDSFTGFWQRDETLVMAVRAAAALAEGYHGARDRIGLVGYGGTLRWILPGTGISQYYKIVDTLIDTEVAVTETSRGADLLPPRSVPTQALIVALSPLADERPLAFLLDLHARGYEVAAIQVVELVGEGDGSAAADLARRLLALRQRTVQRHLERSGIPVATWSDGVPLERPIQEVQQWRQRARLMPL